MTRSAAGRQAYVVCPLVEESEKLEVASAEETYERLSAGELSGLRLGLLHGRMSSAEKERTMDSFRLGQLDVLVATTVIEVGVDVPNATVMVVLDADRFGIAQLHQLRGRVGRGAAESQCWLVTARRRRRPEPAGRRAGGVDGRVRAGGGRSRPARGGHADGRGAEGAQRSPPGVAAAGPGARAAGPRRGVRGRRRRPRARANPALLDELTLLLSPEDTEFLTAADHPSSSDVDVTRSALSMASSSRTMSQRSRQSSQR